MRASSGPSRRPAPPPRARLRGQQFRRQVGGRAGIQQHVVVDPQQRVDRQASAAATAAARGRNPGRPALTRWTRDSRSLVMICENDASPCISSASPGADGSTDTADIVGDDAARSTTTTFGLPRHQAGQRQRRQRDALARRRAEDGDLVRRRPALRSSSASCSTSAIPDATCRCGSRRTRARFDLGLWLRLLGAGFGGSTGPRGGRTPAKRPGAQRRRAARSCAAVRRSRSAPARAAASPASRSARSAASSDRPAYWKRWRAK